jgi:hypothetical protein
MRRFIYTASALAPLAMLVTSLAMSFLVAAGGPCPTQDYGGC